MPRHLTAGPPAEETPAQRRYLALEDMRALDLVRVYVEESPAAFREKAAGAPAEVVASLVRIAQPSYTTQFRDTFVAAIVAGVVTSWITWNMAGKPKSEAARRTRLYKTIRNTGLGVGVTFLLALLRHTRSPERDALWALRRLDPQKVREAKRLVREGYQTPFLPSLRWRRAAARPR